jgi:hypothetical protein
VNVCISGGGHAGQKCQQHLCRAELTASQRTGYTKRRKQIWEALHPEIQVGNLCPPELTTTGYKSPPPQTQGFAASTAEASGMTKRSINQHLARADALGDDVERITYMPKPCLSRRSIMASVDSEKFAASFSIAARRSAGSCRLSDAASASIGTSLYPAALAASVSGASAHSSALASRSKVSAVERVARGARLFFNEFFR